VNGEEEGKNIGWHKNGQKKYESNWINGKIIGKSTWWHDNGTKKGVYTYVNGKKEGKVVLFHPNGKKEGEYYYINGKREGNATQFYSDGSIKAKLYYVKGKLKDNPSNIYNVVLSNSYSSPDGYYHTFDAKIYKNGSYYKTLLKITANHTSKEDAFSGGENYYTILTGKGSGAYYLEYGYVYCGSQNLGTVSSKEEAIKKIVISLAKNKKF